jgi:hypothetical protein
MIGATSCGISDQMRDICISYAGGAGIMLHIKGKFTMGELKSSLLSLSFVINRPSL